MPLFIEGPQVARSKMPSFDPGRAGTSQIAVFASQSADGTTSIERGGGTLGGSLAAPPPWPQGSWERRPDRSREGR